MALDLAGVMVSAGAACSSGKVKPSQVVSAMGRADLAAGCHPPQRRLGDAAKLTGSAVGDGLDSRALERRPARLKEFA